MSIITLPFSRQRVIYYGLFTVYIYLCPVTSGLGEKEQSNGKYTIVSRVRVLLRRTGQEAKG